MICSSCGNPRNGESKNEDNTKEIEIVKKEPITYNFYVENSGSVKGYFKGNTNDAGNIFYFFTISINAFGMHAVAIVSKPSITIPTRCCS